MLMPHGQPSARNNFNFSSCPVLAAASQRRSLRDRRPCRCMRFNTFKRPSSTASSSPSSSNRSPVAATASRIPRLTAGSRARSAGVEILRSEDVRDDDVVEKAGDRVLRVGKARGSSDGRDITARGSHCGLRGVGGHVKGVGCASLCVEASQKRR
jgi:hypothetical protein